MKRLRRLVKDRPGSAIPGASPLKIGSIRPSWLEISRALLEQNFLKLKSFLVSTATQVMAVVKADAYGLGAPRVAQEMSRLGVSWFGVSSVDEGILLRQAGVGGKILVLGSAYPFGESIDLGLKHQLSLTVSSLEGAQEILKTMASRREILGVHLKMETGMQRIGARPPAIADIARTLHQPSQITIEGVYTHLADARNEEFSNEQLACFDQGLALMDPDFLKPEVLIHCANSAATVRYPQSHRSMIRSGLALYGAAPDFEPVMRLKSKIVFLKKVKAGTPISYERAFRVKNDSVIATLPIGYGDGVPLNAWRRAYVLVDGQRAPVAGVITMDMMMIDVTGIKTPRVGMEATLIGSSGQEIITPNMWAQWAKMSVYEFLTGLGATRLAKVAVS